MKDNQIKEHKTSLGVMAFQIQDSMGHLVKKVGTKVKVNYTPTFIDLKGYAGEDAHHFAAEIPLPSGYYDQTDEQREVDDHQWEMWVDMNHPESERDREF